MKVNLGSQFEYSKNGKHIEPEDGRIRWQTACESEFKQT